MSIFVRQETLELNLNPILHIAAGIEARSGSAVMAMISTPKVGVPTVVVLRMEGVVEDQAPVFFAGILSGARTTGTLISVALDPWMASRFGVPLREGGIEPTLIQKTSATLDAPARELQRMFLEQRLNLLTDTRLVDAFSKTRTTVNSKGQMYIGKAHVDDNIDDIFAVILAVAAMQVAA